MSEQRAVDVGANLPPPLTKAQKVARAAQILERGFTNVRLNLDAYVPKDMHYEFVANDPSEIARLQTLGFEDGSKYLIESKMLTHKLGDGRAAVGDVVCMITSKEQKEILDLAQKELIRRRHDPKSKSQIEETNFESNMKGSVPDIPVVGESTIQEVGAQEIQAATGPQGE